MLVALALFGLFMVSFLLTGLIRWQAPAIGMLDVPVARSLHDEAVPVGGGVAIAASFLLYALVCWRLGLVPDNVFHALAAAGALIAGVGLLDDLRGLPLTARLAAQFAAAVWVLLWLPTPPPVDFLLFTLGNGLLLDALAALALVWLLNLYNFMDGIDGLAGTELVFVCALGFGLALRLDDAILGWLCAGLGAAGLGFLAWNWPPAKIFMGDAGSQFIGFSLGVLALLSLGQGSATIWTWLLLLGVFAVDATFTLLRRILRGDPWFEGHCRHAYQHAAIRLGSHRRVTLAVLALNCCWLAPLAWWSAMQPQWGLPLTLVGWTPLALLAWWLGAGTPNKGKIA